jgi:hypothetical protein
MGAVGGQASGGDVRPGPSCARAWGLAYGGLWALTLAVAAALWAVPGGARIARGLLPLALSAARNPVPSVAGVVAIAASNALHCGWPLALGALGVTRRRVARALGDVAVGANVLACAVMVGGALGGYGLRVVAFLPHLPLEWAGVAVGIAAWTVERRRSLRRYERVISISTLVGLLAAAALVEVCATPHR